MNFATLRSRFGRLRFEFRARLGRVGPSPRPSCGSHGGALPGSFLAAALPGVREV